MYRTYRLFFLLGLLLLFSVFFGYLYYVTEYNPFPPKPPKSAYRIPASDSTSFANVFLYDFENFKRSDLLSTAKSFSGKYALRVRGKKDFSLLIQKPVSELALKNFSEARISAWIQADAGMKLNGKFMFQIVDKTNTLKYSYSVDLNEVTPAVNRWFYISGKAMISNYKLEPTDVVKVYFWNNYTGEVFIDDVIIVFGNQQIKGIKPLVDETIDNFKFVPKSNQPPYQTIYALKTLVKNLKNASIQSEDGLVSLEIKDHDEYLTGHFIRGNNQTDQILLIRHHLPFAIIWFIAEKNEFSFRIIDEKVFPVDLAIIQLYAADINGDGTDEIIRVSGNPQNIQVYMYDGVTKNVKLISKERCRMENGVKQLQKYRVNGKRSESFFAIDVVGKSFLLSFERNTLTITPLGNISEASQQNYDSQIVSGNFMQTDGNENILLLYRNRKSGRCFYKLFDIDPLTQTNTCLQQGNFDNKCDTLYPENTYFAEDFNNDGISELISYGNSWRYDMKLISFMEENYQILGNIDFMGYEKDFNPKYYENLMITAGHYADSKTFSFFTTCRNNKPIIDFPESIGIYSLPLTNQKVAK
jgi:hypothetical protein